MSRRTALESCGRCGARNTQPYTGRSRRYCSNSCRQLAYRARKKAGIKCDEDPES